MKLPSLGTGGFAKSVLSGTTAGRMAKSIAFHKAPKASSLPTLGKRPAAFRRYNPIKVSIHSRGSKKSLASGFKVPKPKSFTSAQSAPYISPNVQSDAFGGE